MYATISASTKPTMMKNDFTKVNLHAIEAILYATADTLPVWSAKR